MNPETQIHLELDASQITAFLTCPQKWYYEYKRSITYSTPEEKTAMNAGTYGHGKLEKIYKGVAKNPNIDKINLTNEILSTEDTPEEAQLVNAILRSEVRQRVVMHTYKYLNNDIIPLTPDSVEIGFAVPLYESASKLYIVSGRVDVLGKIQGQNCFMDHKFQMRKSDIYDKSVQFRTYGWALNKQIAPTIGPVNLGMINYIRMAKKVDEETFQRKLISYMPGEHERWEQRLISIFDEVSEFLAQEKWNNANSRRESACDGKYGKCEFIPLCEEYSNGLIESKIQTMYHIKPAWSPWREGENSV